ncbi:unnamed protein product [Schistosoma rodhaini]|uniref:Uncharacterized protein n=1 Tax=Schistosoma rodhaini TaxID=6188 RepID=A0AA85GHG4_9TREM|nr:unnamed protein product [Schistosoma rodhaini]
MTNPPKEAEVSEELQLIKRHKSPDADELPSTLFMKDDDDFLVKELTELFTKVLKLVIVPTLWNGSIVAPIYINGSRRFCNNYYRGINLLLITSKLLVSFMLYRLFKTRERLTREEQASFRSGLECNDHIFTLYRRSEHRHTYCWPNIRTVS